MDDCMCVRVCVHVRTNTKYVFMDDTAITTLPRNWVSRSQTRSADSKELLFPKVQFIFLEI